jgi:S1-C subfamily serine protease
MHSFNFLHPNQVPVMKVQRFFLSMLPLWFVTAPPVLAIPAPAPLLAQLRVDEQASIRVYRQASPAVVTLGQGRSSGSGSIISTEGLILTNDHVVRGARNGQVTVTTADGRRFGGQVVALNPTSDLALVRVQSRDRFPVIPLGNPREVAVGQQVFAIGSPFGLSGTLTTGILSRISPNGDLQTDAAINPGNSGGPLLNSRGELIGVNKAILSPNGPGNVGIGFATSVGSVREFVALNRNNQGIARIPSPSTSSNPDRPRLGIEVDPSTLVIQRVYRNTPASAVGLRPGDRLLGLNGKRLQSLNELLVFLNRQPSTALLTVSRGRQLANVRVVL